MLNKLLIVILLVCVATAWYKEGCYEGYYIQDEGCRPCHSSCRTCTGPYSCETCEDYMFLQKENVHLEDYHPDGVDGKLCEKCPDGQYYDKTGEICRSCDSKCTLECGYQQACFQCSSGDIFDFELMKCVKMATCASPKYVLSNSQYSFPSVCRTLDYYVDPFSSKNIELGTKQYPYRSFTSLASEIVNIHSNSEYNISIFTNDGYLKEDELVLINITNVVLKPLPNYIGLQQERLYKKFKHKPLLVPTNFELHGITEKALFHALKHTDSEVDQALEAGDFTSYELDTFTSIISSIKPLRTSIEIDGVDFYSEEIDYNKPKKLITPIYLQEKLLKITNSNFNVTGEVVTTNDPYSAHFENIMVEGYSLQNFVSDKSIVCNYPEAFLRGSFFAKNISYVISRDRTLAQNGEFFLLTGPYNITFLDIDIGNFYANPGERMSACSISVDSLCIPNDEHTQTLDFHGMRSRLGTAGVVTNKRVMNAIFTGKPHYRTMVSNYSDFEYRDFHNYYQMPMLVFLSTFADKGTFTNFSIINGGSIFQFFALVACNELTVNNFVFENIHSTTRLLLLNLNKKVKMSSTSILNHSSQVDRIYTDIYVRALPFSEITIEGMLVKNANISNFSFLELEGQPKLFVMKDIVYEDIRMNGEISLIKLNSISSFTISNQTLRNITVSERDELRNHYVQFDQLNFLPSADMIFRDIVIENSDISIIKFSTATSQTEARNLAITNMLVHNTHFNHPRSIFEILGDVQLIIQDCVVRNISFETFGDIIRLNNNLDMPVLINNSVFEDISSGSIRVGATENSSSKLKTHLKIENSAFRRIINVVKPFINSIQGSNLIVARSNFSEITSTSGHFGIVHLTGSSIGFFDDCRFNNNSGISSTIFKVEKKSILECDRCKIYSNFGLKDTVFQEVSNGKFIFKNSQIYSNFAIQNSLGSILETVEASEFHNCTIYDNSFINNDYVVQEVLGTCNKLCMMSKDLKDYLGTKAQSYI